MQQLPTEETQTLHKKMEKQKAGHFYQATITILDQQN
jgi:hypothetical protein